MVVLAEAGDDVIENIHGTGDVQVLAHTDEGGCVHNCVFDEHDQFVFRFRKIEVFHL